ncbi:TIM barrel protein [Gordonia amarae]|uniref:Inositol catabolism protein IolH n=2 Tax=Gordonia amarae TaxID=36821 RepID=G7GUT6_9ACTN|nr:sugar phosphate isomerase/epimerase [Gordonia amarae]MCS3876923.1 myo-inositol catabolism protein IolH [Gordonia amarae]QHN15751.1 TIM barrel protein [Gordonia amarae]QHN20320.1 TIM barrel protein [Gordonia amarae]QHN29171.1 TIM barrel protein [Gordonia amarae]QHN37950.1 TIM barrel protein [Gordonia amarae]
MVRIALDPTPYHSTHGFLDFFDVAAKAGYEWIQLTPHPDFIPFFSHPRVDRAFLKKVRERAASAGVGISSLLPVQRISWPEELPREAAVRNFRRIIDIASELEVPVINTEFSGRPERAEESEAGFYRSMETLLPLLETAGVTLNFDPHPDDFVEDGLAAWQILRGLDSAAVGFVYVGSHTFHYGDRAVSLIPELGDRLRAVYAADTFDHHRSHGLRYITNPPGNAVRVHQHLRIGDGDVDWTELFTTLRASGFLDRDDAIICSNVFAEDEHADETSEYQLATLRDLVR